MRAMDHDKRRRVRQRSQELGHCICDTRRGCPCDVFRDQGICPCAGQRPKPIDIAQVKLTASVHNAGCASKIAPADLEAVLARLPEVRDPAVLCGLAAGDDAAIYRIADDLCLVQTVDVFTPCVDDPTVFGRICAANCLSDVYAMGGTPRTALSLLGFPSETLDGEVMYRMLAGAMEIFTEAGVSLIGGHSIKEEEVKLGFAITGTIDPQTATSLDGARVGDVLVLTQPLGTGVLTFYHQIGRDRPEGLAAATASMATLNKAAAEAMMSVGVSACTDITGFGLFGHLIRLLRQSKLTAEVCATALPAFDGAVGALRQGIVPGAIERNREFGGEDIAIEPGMEEAFVHLGFDAQTSGGLLITVAESRVSALLEALSTRGVKGCVIGQIVQAGAPPRPEPTTAHETPPASSLASVPHDLGCCADIFGAKPAGSTSDEALKALGALMRSAQAGGAVDEKAKELTMFSLVLLSKCAPGFEAHYEKARERGITPEELDEAAWCAIAMGGAPVRMFYRECLRKAQSQDRQPACG